MTTAEATPEQPHSAEWAQLVLVRQLLEETEQQLRRGDDFGNGLAVSLAQDAVELLVRIVVRARSISIKEKRPTLEQMMDAIDAASAPDPGVPHRQRIDDLNKARVAFKHTGLCPSRSDAERLVRYGVDVLDVALPRFFGMQARRVFLAYAVRSEKVRDALVKAEDALLDDRHADAVIEAADAVSHADAPLRTLLPELPRMPSLREGVGPQVQVLTDYAAGLRLVSLAGLVGFNIRDLLRFRRLAPSILHSLSGDRQVIDSRLGQYSQDEAEFAVRFATNFALAVQRALG